MDDALLAQGASFSGHERNHLYVNIDGDDFLDVSGVTGLDHSGDSRAFASLDFDRDGWVDVAMVNANAPLFQLHRNRMGEMADAGSDRMVAVRLEGGNRSAEPSEEWTGRDGYGAIVTVRAADRTAIREHRAGEGFAAQNSSTLLVGLDGSDEAGSLQVRWPSGQVWDTIAVPAGMLVLAYENPAHSSTGAPFVFERYSPRREMSRPLIASSGRPASEPITLAHEVLGGARSELVMYTTMATWCAPCLEELPDMERLREAFTTDELEILGVPYDDEEVAETLLSWADTHSPAYQILEDLPIERRAFIRDALLDELKLEGLPATMVTDRQGRVLLTRWGPPSVSEIRKLLARPVSTTDFDF